MIEGNLDFKNIEAIRKISEISDLKDSNLKRACFALGLLCKKIEKAQYRRLKSTPFSGEYKGLSMKLNDLKKLFSKSVEKSNQYGLNTAAIKEYIAENFVEISKNEKISNDDLNYYFALGLSLFDKLFSNTNKEEES
jgi:CRISPR-associated protein Cas8b/Csh1 subtype I-B